MDNDVETFKVAHECVSRDKLTITTDKRYW